MKLDSCQYKYEPDNYLPKGFSCKEEARPGRIFCIFHDENYVKDHFVEYELEATKRFEEKVTESISENKPLDCIGYFLPAIEFAKYFPTTAVKEKKFFSTGLLYQNHILWRKLF